MRRIGFLTIIALLLLRLAIGWHFFLEGLYKAQSWGWVDVRVLNPMSWWHGEKPEPPPGKPFTSEVYLRESTGPLGPYYREHIGDPDERALALLTPKPQEGTSSSPAARVPDQINAEWDAYLERFLATYNLDDKQKADARERLQQAKADLGAWLVGGPDVAAPDTPHRVEEYKARLKEARSGGDGQWSASGWGLDQEKDAQRKTARADAVKLRKELLDDLDAKTKGMKDSLAEVVKAPLTAFAFRDPKNTSREYVAALLTPANDQNTLPPALEDKWQGYLTLFKGGRHLDAAQLDAVNAKFEEAKFNTLAWLRSPETQQRVRLYGTTAPPANAAGERRPLMPRADEAAAPSAGQAAAEATARDKELLAEFDRRNADMKRLLPMALPAWQASAWAPEPEADANAKKEWTFLRVVDWATVIGVTVIGACLLLGLFTRLSCVLGIGFLVLTYLTYPPFPWLPQPPNTEGNPLFVNKNIIELAGLLVLATTASGRWLGLDALIYWFFVDRKKKKVEPKPNGLAA